MLDAKKQGEGSRVIKVLLAVVIGAAGVGFFVGTRPMPQPQLFAKPAAAVVVDAEVVEGQTYWQLRQRRYGPNSKTSSDLTQLRQDFPQLTDDVARSPELTFIALAQRAQRRAFDGSPPVVPHAIDELSSVACLACHQHGVRVASKTATVMPHTLMSQCTQCHAPSLQRFTQTPAQIENHFVGMAAVAAGTRAWQDAPPTIPHQTQLREDCHSCHGITGLDGIRTTHPLRQNCIQCHVPQTSFLPW